MGVASVSLDVSGGGTYASLIPFHIGEAGPDEGQTNKNNNNNKAQTRKIHISRLTDGPLIAPIDQYNQPIDPAM